MFKVKLSRGMPLRKEILSLTNWFLTDNLETPLILDIKTSFGEQWGLTEYEPGGWATVWLDPTLDEEDLLITLTHELVHVRQYHSGMMEDMEESFLVRWGDDEISTKDTPAHVLPWEVEAWSSQSAIYNEWKNL